MNTSSEFDFSPATMEQTKARIALQSPSGNGKTYTALQLAVGLAQGGTVGLIDTENHSASRYARIFAFDQLDFKPPFSPERYRMAIAAAARRAFAVLIIDSISHEWMGQGGVLEMVDAYAAAHKGDSHSAWRELTPKHNGFVEELIRYPGHLIVCMRSKTETARQTNPTTGKQEIVKLGLAPIQRDGIEYEFDLVGEIDTRHTLTIIKSRFSAFDSVAYERPGPEVGQLILAQVSDGVEAPEIPVLIADPKHPDVLEAGRLRALMDAHHLQYEPSAALPVTQAYLRARIATFNAALEAIKEPDMPPAPDENGELLPPTDAELRASYSQHMEEAARLGLDPVAYEIEPPIEGPRLRLGLAKLVEAVAKAKGK